MKGPGCFSLSALPSLTSGSHGYPRSLSQEEGEGVWTVLEVTLTSAHINRRARPTAGKAGKGCNCIISCYIINCFKTNWLKTTMNIYYFTVPMGQDLRRGPPGWVSSPFVHDGVCMWFLELLQLFCHHEGSHFEKEIYIEQIWKNHRRIIIWMIKLNKRILKFPWAKKHSRQSWKRNNEAEGLPDQTGIKQRRLEVAV